MHSRICDRTPRMARKPVDGNAKLGFTLAEAASSTSFGQSTLIDAIKTGDLVARRYGRRVVLTRAELEAFLHSLPRAVA